MNVFSKFLSLTDPLKFAKKKGMNVGNGVTLMSKLGTSFGSEPYLITLEDEVRLSGGVHFITHDGGTWAFRDLNEYKDHGHDIAAYGSIHVGYRTFIGYGVIILPGVNIGSRCVIGAGAIVTKDIPDNSIAVGCPARVIGNTYDYAEKMRNKHLNVQYDYDELKNNKQQYLSDLASQGKI